MMTSLEFNQLLSELRSARESDDFGALLDCLVATPDERAEDVAALYPYAYDVWGVLEYLDDGKLLEAAMELESSFGKFSRVKAPAGFAPLLGDKLHQAMQAARAEREWTALLALEKVAQVMVVNDDEHLFCGEEDPETQEYTQGLDTLWPQLSAVVYDGEAHGGRGEARAYVSPELAVEIGLPGQDTEPVTHPIVDSDGQGTTVYVLPTSSGWVVWVS